jgi:hypothetical protein
MHGRQPQPQPPSPPNHLPTIQTTQDGARATGQVDESDTMGTLAKWIRGSEWNRTTEPLDDSKGTTALGTTNQRTRPGCEGVKTTTPALLPL